MTKRMIWCLAMATLVTMTGCSVATPPSVFDEDQVAGDELPPGPPSVVADLESDSARLLGEAFGHRYWAAEDAEGQTCIVSQLIGEPDAEANACALNRWDGFSLQVEDGVTATWSPALDPAVPESAILLRRQVLVERKDE